MWLRSMPKIPEDRINERLKQLVLVVRNNEEVVGVSTAQKIFVPNLRHHLYNFRCFIDPDYRVPGLTSTLLVKTRDFLEQIYNKDEPSEQAIGIIAMAEDERIKKYRNEAVWPASGMVYIGDTPKGYPIRVYYFRKAVLIN